MESGYMGKLLYVDLTRGTFSDQELSEELSRKYIGGSGLGARLLFDQTNADTDPLGEDNVLIFLTGPLTETPVPMAGRYAVITKSPLGIWGEGDCGGSWGNMLKRTGYDGIVIAGKSEKPVYLWITDGGAANYLPNLEITSMPEAGSTKHENPPLPPFGKGGRGGFSYKCWMNITGIADGVVMEYRSHQH